MHITRRVVYNEFITLLVLTIAVRQFQETWARTTPLYRLVGDALPMVRPMIYSGAY